MRISGTVKFFNGAKGFGFIAPDDGSKDVFVHASALEIAGIQSLNEGDKVTFALEDDRNGRVKLGAKNLKPKPRALPSGSDWPRLVSPGGAAGAPADFVSREIARC